MRICIYGAGAGGGHFAVKLAGAGHDVCVIARGPHLAAIRQYGLQLRAGEELLKAGVKASDDPQQLGEQDIVIVAVKATSLKSIAPKLAPLLNKNSLVIFPQNGMTWWYPLGLPQIHPRPPKLPIFELIGDFTRVLRADQILGGIIYSANEIESPGIIRNNSPAHNRLDVGPVDGRETDAVGGFRSVLAKAGIVSPRPGDIRTAMWTKLLTNMSGSVIALATGNNSDACRDDAGLSAIYRRIVHEGLAITAAHGYPLAGRIDPERMLARLVTNHKPSLLQDYEQSRPMEIGEIVLAPLAFARARNIVTPTLDALAAIVTKRAIDRKLYAQADLAAMHVWDTQAPPAGDQPGRTTHRSVID